MPQISLPNGNVIYVSTYEFYFILKDEDMKEFYQYALAENLGIPSPEDPFSDKTFKSSIKEEDEPNL